MYNYTTINCTVVTANADGSEVYSVKEETHRVYYAQVRDPRYLPDLARTDETMAEWEAWHKAHKTSHYARYLARKMLE